jgi:hypothetical protein
MPQWRKSVIASSAVLTIVLPCRLNDVLINTPKPVRRLNSRSNCGRTYPEPLECILMEIRSVMFHSLQQAGPYRLALCAPSMRGILGKEMFRPQDQLFQGRKHLPLSLGPDVGAPTWNAPRPCECRLTFGSYPLSFRNCNIYRIMGQR